MHEDDKKKYKELVKLFYRNDDEEEYLDSLFQCASSSSQLSEAGSGEETAGQGVRGGSGEDEKEDRVPYSAWYREAAHESGSIIAIVWRNTVKLRPEPLSLDDHRSAATPLTEPNNLITY
ncbi:hypothetical protein BU16DRAFT_535509 [Lophium mytilinum]|uniref:Uncharacterized protein n=1 Tax=Lophium mytilinum TaxID=390894 RepID=A0A6A6R2Z6_9PEZI|nr:hypothetical protein BU16DRAFT_535509 [Lophium mytilinum]